MKFRTNNALYVPGLGILAAVIILLLLTGISTYRNLNQVEDRAMADLRAQGVMLLRALEAGARTGMMMPMWREDELARLFHETARDRNLVSVYLIDSDNRIVHHSDHRQEGKEAEWVPPVTPAIRMPSEIVSSGNNESVFYMAKPFMPDLSGIGDMYGHTEMFRHQHDASVLVVGLSMSGFAEAQRRDVNHAVFMAAIVVTLGAGAFFFLFIIQNYYAVGRALARNRDDTRQVIRNMADGLISVDREGRLLFMNDKAVSLLGLSYSPSPGGDIRQAVSFDTVGIQAALDTGITTLNREILVEMEPGLVRPLSFNVTPLCEEDGRARGAVALIRDLTELKTLESQMRHAETLAAVGELAASVAHEIRNPLSSIRTGVLFLTRRMTDDATGAEYGDLIVSEVDRINQVVNDLLTFSHPGDPERHPEDLVDICRHTLQLVTDEAASKNVKVRLDNDANSVVADVDRAQIIQVLLNLYLNALASIEKEGALIIRVAHDDSHRWANISVTDTGSGISAQDRERIFEPFFTTREHGTGLGLAIAKKVVDAHGGQIELESPPPGKSRGSRFTVRLLVSNALPLAGETT